MSVQEVRASLRRPFFLEKIGRESVIGSLFPDSGVRIIVEMFVIADAPGIVDDLFGFELVVGPFVEIVPWDEAENVFVPLVDESG